MEDNTSRETERDSVLNEQGSELDQQLLLNDISRDSTSQTPAAFYEKFHELIKLLLISLMLLLFATMVATTLARHLIDGPGKSGDQISDGSLIFYLSLGIIACMVLLEQLVEEKVTSKPDVNIKNEKLLNALLRKSLSFVGLMFFGPFACFLKTCEFFIEISCHTFRLNNRTEEWTNASDSQEIEQANNTLYSMKTTSLVLFVLFIGLELLLCVQFRGLRFSEGGSKVRGCLVKASLMVLVVVDLGMWFETATFEAMHNYESNKESSSSSHESTSNVSCSAEQFGILEGFLKRSLYPFTVEFFILSVEFVISQMIFDHETDQGTEHEHASTTVDVPGNVPDAENKWSRRDMSLIAPLVIVFGVFLNMLYIAFTLFAQESISGEWAKQHFSRHCLEFETFYWLVVTLLVVVGTVCMIKCKFTKSRELQGFDYLVLASVVIPFLSRVGMIALIVKDTRSDLPIAIRIAPEILNLIQILLQTPFLFYSENVDCSPPNDKELVGKVLKAMIMSLALCNITLWFIDSVMPRVDCLKLSVVDDQHPFTQYSFLQEVFRPVPIFYRFSSFLLLLRAYLR